MIFDCASTMPVRTLGVVGLVAGPAAPECQWCGPWYGLQVRFEYGEPTAAMGRRDGTSQLPPRPLREAVPVPMAASLPQFGLPSLSGSCVPYQHGFASDMAWAYRLLRKTGQGDSESLLFGAQRSSQPSIQRPCCFLGRFELEQLSLGYGATLRLATR